MENQEMNQKHEYQLSHETIVGGSDRKIDEIIASGITSETMDKMEKLKSGFSGLAEGIEGN